MSKTEQQVHTLHGSSSEAGVFVSTVNGAVLCGILLRGILLCGIKVTTDSVRVTMLPLWPVSHSLVLCPSAQKTFWERLMK